MGWMLVGVVINGTPWEGRTARDVEEGERCAAPCENNWGGCSLPFGTDGVKD